MRFEQTEFRIRVLPCGQCHIQPTNKGAAEIRRRRVLFASERPFVPRCTFSSEMNVPLLQRETHVLNLCSDHVDQSFLLFVTYVVRRTFREQEDFRNEFARGDRADEAKHFWGHPRLTSLQKQMLAAMETTIGDQTNNKQITLRSLILLVRHCAP